MARPIGDDVEIIPPAPRFQEDDGSIRVPVKLGRTATPDLEVRSVDYDAEGSGFGEQIVQSIAQGLRLGLLLALNAGFWSAACMILAGPLYQGSFPEWWSWWRSIPIWS